MGLKTFDRKFGKDLLSRVPSQPGIYRFYDVSRTLVYVGKAKNLRRRLSQYRSAGRLKKNRKHRTIVSASTRIEWEVCDSDLEACLREIRVIQKQDPTLNTAGAFSFLYPFIGILQLGIDIYFCLTTKPEAFEAFALHGAFRSRFVVGNAFFALMRCLRFLGHPVARSKSDRLYKVEHSYVFGFRRLPGDFFQLWSAYFRGTSRTASEKLLLGLLEHAAARAKRALVQEDLCAIDRFFEEEAAPLAAAIEQVGYPHYPLPQLERDPIFLEYRDKRNR